MLLVWTSSVLAAQQHALCDERFFFHQLLAGRDVAVPDKAATAHQRQIFTFAKSMQNFMYLIGDSSSGECFAIDACYDPEGVIAAAQIIEDLTTNDLCDDPKYKAKSKVT